MKKRLKSFSYAFQGLATLLKEEPNAKIHLVATVCVVILGFIFNLAIVEWCLIALSIGFVIGMEAFNTAIENLSDFVSPQRHPLIKKVKDLAAAGVVLSAVAASVVGGLIFIPKIF